MKTHRIGPRRRVLWAIKGSPEKLSKDGGGAGPISCSLHSVAFRYSVLQNAKFKWKLSNNQGHFYVSNENMVGIITTAKNKNPT